MAVDQIFTVGTPPTAVKFLYWNRSGQVYNTNTPGWESWDDTHYANYGVSAVQQGTSPTWIATRPAGVASPVVPILIQVVSVVGGTPDSDPIIGTGGVMDANTVTVAGTAVEPVESIAIDGTVNAVLIPAASGGAASNDAPAIDGDLITKSINYAVAIAFEALNVDSTGWTQFVFTVKSSASDTDADAILTVQLTNPGAGSDGLTLINGAAPSGFTSASDGALVVAGVTTNTTLALTLSARGHAIPASNNYVWELTRYSGGAETKYMIGRGTWAAVQSVRINPIAS